MAGLGPAVRLAEGCSLQSKSSDYKRGVMVCRCSTGLQVYCRICCRAAGTCSQGHDEICCTDSMFDHVVAYSRYQLSAPALCLTQHVSTDVSGLIKLSGECGGARKHWSRAPSQHRSCKD
jgi:hypothetical protein